MLCAIMNKLHEIARNAHHKLTLSRQFVIAKNFFKATALKIYNVKQSNVAIPHRNHEVGIEDFLLAMVMRQRF